MTKLCISTSKIRRVICDTKQQNYQRVDHGFTHAFACAQVLQPYEFKKCLVARNEWQECGMYSI